MEFQEWREIAERLITNLYDSHEKTQEELRTLARSQVLLSEASRKTEEKLAETTEKLDALIAIVEQHLQ